jgi:TolB protein
MKSGLVLALSLVLVAPALAQDTPPPADGGVRVGITYTPGIRSRLVLLPGTGLDSARAIIQRDLDYSDRFEVLTLGPGAPGGGGGIVNYPLYRTLGADYGVEVAPSGSGVNVRLHDVRAGQVRQQQGYYLPPPGDPGFRMAVHAISDEVVRWATGTPGIAASRMLFISSKRVYRVDGDGANLTAISPAGRRHSRRPGRRTGGMLPGLEKGRAQSSCSGSMERAAHRADHRIAAQLRRPSRPMGAPSPSPGAPRTEARTFIR